MMALDETLRDHLSYYSSSCGEYVNACSKFHGNPSNWLRYISMNQSVGFPHH